MHYIYIITVLLCLFIFLIKRRYLDFISIYFVLLFLYNISTFLGFVVNPVTKELNDPNVYMYIVSIFPILFCTIFLIQKQPLQDMKRQKEIINSFQSKKYRDFLFFLTITFVVIIFMNFTAMFYSESKTELLENQSITSIFKVGIPPVAIMISYLGKHRFYFLFFVIFVITLFFFGGRAGVVSSTACLLLVRYYGKTFKLINNWKLILGGLVGIGVIMLGKTLYGFVLFYGFSNGIIRWYDNFNSDYFLVGGEFISNSAILNAVITEDFSISSIDVFTSLFSILPIPVSVFGFKSGVFNDRFQAVLFSDVEYGMAYSIWGEAYSWAGLLGVVIISIVIPFALKRLWFFYNKYADQCIGIIVVLVGFVLAFWVHRNSIGTILANIRNVFYPVLILWLFSSLIYKIRSSK